MCRRLSQQEGYVIATTTVLLFAFLGFAALAVDVGMLYTARTAAQKGADAGALSGAFTFVNNPFAPQPATAEEYALQTTVSNVVSGENIDPSQVTVTVDLANRRVFVDIDREERTFLARVMFPDLVDVRVRAVAEAAPFATGSYCVKPWFIPSTVLSDEDPCQACFPTDGSPREVLLEANEITTWAWSAIATEQIQRVKPGLPRDALQPGSFYAIRLGDSTGGNDYRQNIATCDNDVLIRCSYFYPVEPGNMIGPTVQGVRDLIGSPADTFIHVGEYQSGGMTVTTSRSLVTLPVWDTCGLLAATSECADGSFDGFELDPGATLQIQVVGFVTMFISGVQGNDVMAYVVSASACGDTGGGGEPSDGSTGDLEPGPYSIPVRLIRDPGLE